MREEGSAREWPSAVAETGVPVKYITDKAGPLLQRLRAEAQAAIEPLEFVRTIAVARILMPESYVRLSAGRTEMSDELQSLCFLAGANSMFYGERLLTTDNPETDSDRDLFSRLGIEMEKVDDEVEAARVCCNA